jgi:hypothetical protein
MKTKIQMFTGVLVLAIFAVGSFAQGASIGLPAVFDIGSVEGKQRANHIVVGAEQPYSNASGFGWVAQPDNLIRFSYHDQYSSPTKWKRDATQSEGNSTFFPKKKKYWKNVGATPAGSDGSFVYEFVFPGEIETIVLSDIHTVWGSGRANKVVMWTSADGKNWTKRHDDKRKFMQYYYKGDFSNDFRGKKKFFVKYFFHGDEKRRDVRAGARVDSFSLVGTLRGEMPADFQPKPVGLTLSAMNYTAGALDKKGGAIINNFAIFRIDLPAGAYYVETLSNRADYNLYVGDARISAPNRPKWRDNGKANTRTVSGRVNHKGGALDIRIQSKGELVNLHAIRIMKDHEHVWPVRFENGRLVFASESTDPAVKKGVGIWQTTKFEHTPEITPKVLSAFAQVKDVDMRATLIALAGTGPNVKGNNPSFRKANKLLRGIISKYPNNVFTRDLLDDMQCILKGDRKYRHFWWDDVPKESVLYPVLIAVKGRFAYNEWMERGRQKKFLDKFMPLVAEAKKTYPNDTFIRMYNLEDVLWGKEYMDGAENAPRWAALQRELLGRTLHVINWWVDNRQRKNGSFGGSLNDDVEALRPWIVPIVAFNDRKIQAAAQKLSDGIWKSKYIVNGYSRELWDVQHSSEETSDSQPQFIGVRYGDPEWIWRNMLTLTCMRDVWTDINPKGYRHFKSAYISATEIDTKGKRAVDVPYATRAVKPGHWLGWYANYPEVNQLMSEWAEAWVVASMRSDRGKPRGIPPAGVAFKSGQLGGLGKSWYSIGLDHWRYFKWPRMVNATFEQMLLAYTLTDDPKYLEPFTTILDLARKYEGKSGFVAMPGTEAWAMSTLLGNKVDPKTNMVTRGRNMLWSVFGKWRVLTGDTRYDDLLKRVGTPYVKFYLMGETKGLEEEFEKTLEKGSSPHGLGAMRYNLPMLTSEVKYTDRIFIRGYHTLYATYTGSFGKPDYCPAQSVTWENAGKHFAALVSKAEKNHVQVRTYNFEKKPNELNMLVWRMPRGRCRLTLTALDGSSAPETREVTITERGDRVALTLPSRKEMLIDLKLIEKVDVPRDLPDVAVDLRNMSFKPKKQKVGDKLIITAKVHNIGVADAKNCKVMFIAESNGAERVIGTVDIGTLPRSRDLKPSTKMVSITWTIVAPKPKRIRAEVSCSGPQITVRNDIVKKPL